MQPQSGAVVARYHIKAEITMHSLFFVAALFALTATSTVALAQVPPDIVEGIRKIGPIVDAPGTAKLYAPLLVHWQTSRSHG